MVALGVTFGLAAAVVTWTAGRAARRPEVPPRSPIAVLVDSAPSDGRCGATRRLNGVPVGWPPSEQGAVGAAAAYAKVLSSLWFLADRDGARRWRAVEVMAAPGKAEELGSLQDRLARQVIAGAFGAGLGRRGVSSVLTTAYLGYRLDTYAETTARVALWAVVIYGNDGGLLPQAVWTTSTLTLRWAAGDWKLEDVVTVAGPVPVHGQDSPSVPGALVAAANSFKGFTDVAVG